MYGAPGGASASLLQDTHPRAALNFPLPSSALRIEDHPSYDPDDATVRSRAHSTEARQVLVCSSALHHAFGRGDQGGGPTAQGPAEPHRGRLRPRVTPIITNQIKMKSQSDL